MDQCIVCESTKNLNTEITIKLESGEKQRVLLCDQHEETSPKEARKYIAKRSKQLDEFMEQAKALGYEIKEGNILVPVKKESIQEEHQEPQTPKPEPKKKSKKQDENDENEVVLDHIPMVDTGAVRGKNIQTHQSLNIDNFMRDVVAKEEKENISLKPKTDKVVMQTVSGRGGIPMNIPKEISGNIGNTIVKIVNSGGDRALQDRFKEDADRSKVDGAKISSNYSVKDCSVCNGTGIARMGGKECPKCAGTGLLNI